jgi:hypothetical protein
MPEHTLNPFGFPVRAQHVCEGAVRALITAAGTKDQLDHALHTISRIEQTPVKVAPRPAESKEITPACKKYYDELAAHGSAEEVLKVASISRRFRTSYPGAVSWAQKQKSQTPVIA